MMLRPRDDGDQKIRAGGLNTVPEPTELIRTAWCASPVRPRLCTVPGSCSQDTS